MKVILLENVKRIGSIGEVIDVKRGYARNFLIANPLLTSITSPIDPILFTFSNNTTFIL